MSRACVPAIILMALVAGLPGARLAAQVTTVGDLTLRGEEVPLRLVGYGLVLGLEGSGDRSMGGREGGGFTARSVANLLRRFEIEVPESVLRTRNVAAVLVTAETSPWLRPGGRFTVHVSSMGDATSLAGGVLWMTPLVAEAGGAAVATAQGALIPTGGEDRRYQGRYQGGTTAVIPDGGVMEVDLPREDRPAELHLFLRQPDEHVAERIVEALNREFGDGIASVEDPGSIRLEGGPGAPSLSALSAVEVTDPRRPVILVDSREGTVVAGGGIRIGEVVVSHEGMTLAVQGGGDRDFDPSPGEVRMEPGVSVQDVAAALHAVGASARDIAAILRGLRDVGALKAEVVVR